MSEFPEVNVWHRNRDQFLSVLKAAKAYREAHEDEYPGHLVFVDERGGIDFTMVCFACADEVKRVRRRSL